MVRAVYVNRPTFRPNLYQQMIGRGLRGPLDGSSMRCLSLTSPTTLRSMAASSRSTTSTTCGETTNDCGRRRGDAEYDENQRKSQRLELKSASTLRLARAAVKPTVSARIEYLLDEEDLSGEEILVISFSRAAVEAVQRRQRQKGSRSWVWVTTIDSLATRVLSDEGVDVTGLGFDARIKELTRLLAEAGIEDPLPDVRHVIIDEVQDVVGIRANLVTLLLAALPDDVGFTIWRPEAGDLRLPARRRLQRSGARSAERPGASCHRGRPLGPVSGGVSRRS